MTLTATTSHTVGPYYHIGLTWLNREDLTVAQTLGQRVAITGQVIDGNGEFVNDAMLEVWQANETDPLLACVPEERRATIVSKPDASGVYQWNVVLQGTDAETVFFDY